MDKILKKAVNDLNSEVGWNLYKTGMMLRRQGMRRLAEFGVTPEQWQVLMILMRKGPLTQKEIRDITIQDAPAISRVIQRMLRKKYVKKAAALKDKRAVLIKLAPAGVEILDRILSKMRKHHKGHYGNFTDSKKKKLIALLKELRLNIAYMDSNGGKK